MTIIGEEVLTQEESKSRLTAQIAVATGDRFLINTARRFAYPFATALSRGLGVPLTAITSLIAFNSAPGLLGPILGPLSDRLGYRLMMLLGLGAMAIGMLVGGFIPTYLAVMFALLMAGFSKALFDPALQAYASSCIPYERRGFVIGIMEFSWAASSLIGIPVIGWLIAKTSWRAPFFLIGGLAAISWVVLANLLPRPTKKLNTAGPLIDFKHIWQQFSGQKAILASLCMSTLIAAAADNIFVVYGLWLEESFGLTTATIGAATIVIGVAELLGEGTTASLSDRLGLKNSIATGTIISCIGYILLPTLGKTLPTALITLFIVFVAQEFTIVSTISLFTEMMPQARATILSTSLATFTLGRMLGTLAGGKLWFAGGIMLTGLTSAAISVVTLGILLWGLRD
ncbi:MAG: MFS transporter [Anaerolineae bacterium]|nr:MFS transporter [Anaerolineae bacterium]